MSPQRIQRKRTKGWRMPEGAVYVGRPTQWGNPFIPGEQCQLWHKDCSQDARPGDMYRDWFMVTDQLNAVRLFRSCIDPDDHRWTDMLPGVPDLNNVRAQLAGRDLACWCKLSDPCHADVLLEFANGAA